MGPSDDRFAQAGKLRHRQPKGLPAFPGMDHPVTRLKKGLFFRWIHRGRQETDFFQARREIKGGGPEKQDPKILPVSNRPDHLGLGKADIERVRPPMPAQDHGAGRDPQLLPQVLRGPGQVHHEWNPRLIPAHHGSGQPGGQVRIPVPVKIRFRKDGVHSGFNS